MRLDEAILHVEADGGAAQRADDDAKGRVLARARI